MKLQFRLSLLFLLALSSLSATNAKAQTPLVAPIPVSPAPVIPAPVSEVVAKDVPNDVGKKIAVSWQLSPDDTVESDPRQVIGYLLERQSDFDNGWVTLAKLDYGTASFPDERAKPGRSYQYRVTVLGAHGGIGPTVQSDSFVLAQQQWFDGNRGWFAVLLTLICTSVIGFIFYARSGADLKVRKIAGLEVVDEAVGRATEMGRSCLFVPGILDINDIQTISALTVLGRVAETAAVYDCPVEVPTSKSLVMTAAQESVAASYMTAGVPDAFNPNTVYYVTDEQFGYVAYLTGKMVREEPAACFYMGAFFAESLILAETGNTIGAIQVAGTAQPSQLPFFVASCDYTLIGEEFFAASAYLSGEPDQLGSLKGQDIGKLLAGILILVGCLLATIAASDGTSANGWTQSILDYLLNDILRGGGA